MTSPCPACLEKDRVIDLLRRRYASLSVPMERIAEISQKSLTEHVSAAAKPEKP